MSAVSLFSLGVTLVSSITMFINSRTMKHCGAKTASKVFLGLSISFAVVGIALAVASNVGTP